MITHSTYRHKKLLIYLITYKNKKNNDGSQPADFITHQFSCSGTEVVTAIRNAKRRLAVYFFYVWYGYFIFGTNALEENKIINVLNARIN